MVRGKRVCVTGGAGFVGSHLVDAFAPDNDVTVVDDCSNGRPTRLPSGVDLVAGDVRDRRVLEEAMADADVVFHQAGLVGVAESVDAPVRANCVNVGATVTLLDLARRHDVRVVLASSAAVYGRPERVPITEDHPTEPTSPYGVDKLAADHYARVFAEVYGLPTVALRYFNVYGPRQRDSDYGAVVAAFLRRVAAGEPLVVHGDGSQTRDFVHVDDVVEANRLAAETDRTGRAYNVGSGESTSIARLAELVRSLADRPVEIEHGEPRTGDIDHSEADLSRSRELLGYHPSVSLREGLRPLVSGPAAAE
jgi:UDP-glucose 4-epimerase